VTNITLTLTFNKKSILKNIIDNIQKCPVWDGKMDKYKNFSMCRSCLSLADNSSGFVIPIHLYFMNDSIN
jgi:hypothetical protein